MSAGGALRKEDTPQCYDVVYKSPAVAMLRADSVVEGNVADTHMKPTSVSKPTRRKFSMIHRQWKDQTLSKALFPELPLSSDPLASATSVDLLIALNNPVKGFPGIQLLFVGESYGPPDAQGSYYFGPGTPANSKGNIHIFNIVRTTLFHPYSANDFLRPRESGTGGSRFLIYMQKNCVAYRERAFDAVVRLSMEKGFDRPVSAGKCHGRHPETSEFKNDLAKRIENGVQKMKAFRFALVMENSNKAGYVTERLGNAFMANTIPIYYGHLDVFKLFNRDAFIFYDINNPQPALDRISFLEKNRGEYERVLSLPVLANGKQTLEDYWSLSDDVGGGKLKQKIRTMIGIPPSTN
eukprot:g2770.t1